MNYNERFVVDVKDGIIPNLPPLDHIDYNSFFDYGSFLPVFQARQECNDRGMWAIIDKKWTKQLAKWIDGRKCLEVMSGAGWLAKALDIHGVDIIATDNFSWKNKQHKEMKLIYPVKEMDGLDAVSKYNDRDILIVSWPPYESENITYICNQWSERKPIVYIGEGFEGCCAPKSFWNSFKEDENAPDIRIPQWWGLHDFLTVGYWHKIKVKTAIEQLEV